MEWDLFPVIPSTSGATQVENLNNYYVYTIDTSTQRHTGYQNENNKQYGSSWMNKSGIKGPINIIIIFANIDTDGFVLVFVLLV